MAIHFPKGEGIKIIRSETEAKVKDSVYILPIDEKNATVIIIDKAGNKRTVGIEIPENLAKLDIFSSGGELQQEGNVYSKSQVDEMIKEAEAVFKTTWDVNLPNNPLGANGIKATEGEKIEDFLKQILRKASAATYAAPTATASGDPMRKFEVGETVELNIKGFFTRNDAGIKTTEAILKDGSKVADADTFDDTIVISETPVNYVYRASYNAGAVKNDSLGSPSPSGQIQAGTVTSGNVTYVGRLKIFYGADEGGDVRSLDSRFEDDGNSWTMNSGTAARLFMIALPKGKTLISVVDADALNANITSSFATIDSFAVPDAGGTEREYTLYYLQNASPYSTNHRLNITIA